MSTKYTKEVLQDAVESSLSYAGVLRHLGLRQAGGTQSHIIKRIKDFNIDVSHFSGQSWGKGLKSNKRKHYSEILIMLKEGSYREKSHLLNRALIESGVEYSCVLCGISNEWNGSKITLEVDHIDGNWLNNLISNLRFLCPNCHSQQSHTNRSHKNAPLVE